MCLFAQSGFPYKFFARVVSSADGLGGAFMGCAPSPTFRRTPRSGRRACDEDLAELRVSIRALGPPLTDSVGGDGLCSGLVPTIIAHRIGGAAEGSKVD